ncbi:MAG TPA: glycerol kinase [Acidimicrobiales bacterium]|nr:glycerol kinase [Acidimicrobiales bacterium]
MGQVLSIDAGTTGVRAMTFGEDGRPLSRSYREITQHFPRPGWVEHDPQEIWEAVCATVQEALAGSGGPVAAVGVTNQRETVVAWDRRSGRPLQRALVWQDRRTAPRCAELDAGGHLPMIRHRTGLVLDPYFSSTKMEWLLTEGGVPAGPDLALGTVDSWVIWNLTGGPSGGLFVTDPSNASRTMLFDIRRGCWDEDLLGLFGVPVGALAEVRPSSGDLGRVKAASLPALADGTPVAGVAGDQQAALFGQACFDPGQAKNTYGTGSFVLINNGPTCPEPADGLLASVAWQLGPAPSVYAVEGSVFVTGAALQWLRDGLGIISDVAETEALAAACPDTEGVYFVPALTGLGSPWWDPDARGVVVGLSRGSGRAHLARAAVESMAFQTRDVIDTMTRAGCPPISVLRVDGGASVMELLLQIQADQLQVPVARATVAETTALGAAWLAGLGQGVWGSLDDLRRLWKPDVQVEPRITRGGADTRHAGWLRALERSRSWARSADLA